MTFWGWIGSWVMLIGLGIIALILIYAGGIFWTVGSLGNDLLSEIVGGLLILGGILIVFYIVYRRAKGAGYIKVSGGH